jgi:hypothetical protein
VEDQSLESEVEVEEELVAAAVVVVVVAVVSDAVTVELEVLSDVVVELVSTT